MTEARAAASLAEDVSPHHHGSHRNLLTTVDAPQLGLCQVDAIIVPTVRPAGYLRRAVELAAKLRCTLLTLHSDPTSAASVRQLAWSHCVDITAVDMNRLPRGLLPQFGTTSLLAATPFARETDTSSKRNFGLLLARACGWQHVVFLDDDIDIPDPQHLTDAVRLLHHFDGVGLTIRGYPDNSVVCHAYRETGGCQDTFIGGGALAVNPMTCQSFFPDIYNEDWFFLLSNTCLRPFARTTGTAVQKPYDPFADVMRARSEEFGDVLGEGVFWLLDQGKRVQDADEGYWRRFLHERQAFITDVLRRADYAPMAVLDRERMKVALRAARGRSTLIAPELCVQYLKAWRTDRGRWRRHLERYDRIFAEFVCPGLHEVLLRLRLEGQSSRFTSTSHISGNSRKLPSGNQSTWIQFTRSWSQ
jgi:hypothetical protein